MKKKWKWLKKSYYLILFAAAGLLYLGLVDKWQVYADSAAAVKQWYAALSREDFRKNPTQKEEGENQSGNAGGENQPGNPGGEDQSGNVGGENQPGNPGGENQSGNPGEDAQTPAYVTVEDDYFADAVFIGDSRTVGMFEYGGLEETAAFYASTGLTVYKMFTAEIVTVPGQKKKITIEEALQNHSFRKIYLMIGINEMGTGNVDTFMEKYEEVVQHLQELQPDAVIYLQGIMKVTTKRSEQGDYITNEGIEARNERIAELADNRTLFYLDVNPLICDESGGMEESYTFDGVHLKARYIEIWKQYLKEHAIELP